MSVLIWLRAGITLCTARKQSRMFRLNMHVPNDASLQEQRKRGSSFSTSTSSWLATQMKVLGLPVCIFRFPIKSQLPEGKIGGISGHQEAVSFLGCFLEVHHLRKGKKRVYSDHSLMSSCICTTCFKKDFIYSWFFYRLHCFKTD